ncbi:DUF1311 domain-containing protein [Acinetobacter cumulans]|uniref:DUF1311 domain-containing protein n=1 Tax=Acinetobacter cumulans TaxID=2136182 RepID=A0A3A8G872_9GAMM|nr:lysozyme inhibitor LprI family protein [Acinetobacter cumulans]RKG55085.1 DUF1311 domain-containing protein [Acinetobacter cumulans]
MKNAFFILSIFASILSTSHALANELSKEYISCTKKTYGDPDVIQKCINTELKQQNKYLKKNYKAFLKNAGEFEENYKTQHLLWQNRAMKVCGNNTATIHLQIKQSQCILGLTAERATYYQIKVARQQ